MDAAPGIDVVFLGTGARWPTPERGVAATIVMRGPDHVLIDCGEGTQRQMMRSIAGLRRRSAILVTHCHADHVLGLPGLPATLSDFRSEPLTILGPAGIRAVVEVSAARRGARPGAGGGPAAGAQARRSAAPGRRAAEVLAEARGVFSATVAPEDLDLVEVPLAERGPPRLRVGGGRGGM